MHELGHWHGPMLERHFLPCPSLAPFISTYQLLTQEHAEGTGERWYILPDNAAHLIFYLVERHGQLLPSLRLIGPRTRHKLIHRRQRWFTFIASFKPGAFYHFSPVPMAELTDASHDARDLSSHWNNELIDKLAVLAKRELMPQFIEQFEEALHGSIRSLPSTSSLSHSFVHMHFAPMASVREIAQDLGITERHLRSLTRDQIGHSPKMILQIERFTQSLRLSNAHRDWTAIAYEAGYYDQSHMIAAYQKMTGSSPERLFNT